MPETPAIRTLGIVGAGRLGSVLARLAVEAGFRVLVAGAADPQSRRRAMKALGAEATTVSEAVDAADAVVLALPLGKVHTLPAGLMRGKLVIDATNYWWGADGERPDLNDPRTSTSEIVQRHLAGSRVVKALSHMGYQDLEDEARPLGAAHRKAIAIAGDDDSDVAAVASLVDALGFDPVPAGPLAVGIRWEPGAEAFGADVEAAELRAMLERFTTSQRGIVVARARAATTDAERSDDRGRPPLA